MELLYIWVNRTSNNIFREQDVCITGEYNIKFDLKSHKLKITKNTNYNLFKNNVIENVSALIGENGAGKTTLLKYIFENSIFPKYKETRPEYVESEHNNYMDSKTIQVFKDKGKIIVLHNMEEKIISDYQNILIMSMDNTTYEEIMDEESYLNSVTKIYLSNDNYLPSNLQGWSSTNGSIDKVALTPESMKVFSNQFYRKIIQFPDGLIEDNFYNGLQDIIISEKNDLHFQSICYVLYFYHLSKNKERLNNFAGKVSTKLLISSDGLIKLLVNSKEKKPKIYRTNNNFPEVIEQKIKLWNSFIKSNHCDTSNIIVNMKLNFIFELDFMWNIITEDLISKHEGEDCLFNNYVFLVASKYKINDKEFNYYNNAVKEINKLIKILNNCNYKTNLFPINDLAFKSEVEIDFIKNPIAYNDFIKFIYDAATYESSFILKYIKIDNLEMSSGEKAYLNFFSRLNLMPFFNKIVFKVKNPARKSILLLIDEIDLYCHPDWQRKFIKFLLDELSIQFPNNKIQIIFTTHSPIVLSDIPISNTIYIKKENNNISTIDNRSKHKQTFAANIYQLFNDAFFLGQKGAIGEYAKNQINYAIKQIRSSENVESSNVRDIIETIGEPVIKKKLLNMYYEAIAYKNDNKTELINNKLLTQNIEQEKLIKLKKQLELIINQINDDLD